MKTLYDENHRYTPDATGLSANVGRALHSIFKDYIELGYSPIEISHIMHSVVFDLEMESILDADEDSNA